MNYFLVRPLNKMVIWESRWTLNVGILLMIEIMHYLMDVGSLLSKLPRSPKLPHRLPFICISPRHHTQTRKSFKPLDSLNPSRIDGIHSQILMIVQLQCFKKSSLKVAKPKSLMLSNRFAEKAPAAMTAGLSPKPLEGSRRSSRGNLNPKPLALTP